MSVSVTTQSYHFLAFYNYTIVIIIIITIINIISLNQISIYRSYRRYVLLINHEREIRVLLKP